MFCLQLCIYAQFQKAQIDEFCEQYGLNKQQYTLPVEAQEVGDFHRHMLVDKHRETMFCFVPKAGCTNLKIIFLANQDLIPNAHSMTRKEIVKNHGVEKWLDKASIRHFGSETEVEMLKNYFKFIMVRNPLERLVSGYRDKIAGFPLMNLHDNVPDFNYLRKAIFQYNHPKEYTEWVKHVQTNGNTVTDKSSRTFGDFINYWSTEPESLNENEHYKPAHKLCQVCRVKYDFYANFKNFTLDSKVLIEKVNASSDLLFSSYHAAQPVDRLYSAYYTELSLQQKQEVLRVLSTELDFYYRLFPEEKNCHKQILDIEDDIQEPNRASL